MAQCYTSNSPGTFAAEVRKRGGSYTVTIPHVIVNKLALRPGLECKIEIEKDGKKGSLISALKANQRIVYFPIPAISRKELNIALKDIVNVKIEKPTKEVSEC